MLPHFVGFALLVLSTSAETMTGPLRSGPVDTPEAEQAFEAAGRQPNAVSSVTFNRTFNNTPETWAWGINTTELAVPDRIYDLGTPEADFSEGLRVTDIQWQLQWPGSDDEGSNFQSFLCERNMNASFSTVILTLPSNITDSYKNGDDGDCVPILGEQCTKSLIRDPRRREGCENTLGVNVGGIRGGIDFDVNCNANPDIPLNRNGTLYFHTTDTYTADVDSPTPLDQAKGALHVLIMSFEYEPGARGEMSGPSALCRIVDNDVDSPDSSNSPAPSDTPPSEAVCGRRPMFAVWVAAVLSALVLL